MKKTVSVCFILLSFLTASQWSSAQEIRFPMQVLYEITCFPDSTKLDQARHEMGELLVNDSMAVFRSVNKGLEAKSHFEASRIGNIPAGTPKTIFDFEIIQKGTEINYLGHIESTRNGIRYAVGYHDDMETFDWVLHHETSEVLGYTCQRATLEYAGRQWEAWFTPDIPIQYGPFRFGNLPGLILQMEDASGEWKFEAQSINSDPNRISHFILAFSKTAQVEHVDRNTYYRKKNEYLNTGLERAMARGFNFSSKEAEERTKEVFRRLYYESSNWIEFGDERTVSPGTK